MRRLRHARTFLGVQLDVSTTVAIVQPTPKRRAKLEALAQRHLDAGKFSPTEAGSFAGKAGFFDSITLGRVGRAALKPVFARQHAKFHTSRLSPALTASRSTFVGWRASLVPGLFPWTRHSSLFL